MSVYLVLVTSLTTIFSYSIQLIADFTFLVVQYFGIWKGATVYKDERVSL